IHELDGQRSALRIADFLIENPENEPAVAALGTWFGWSGEEMSQLQKIVHGHAQRVRAWEQRMMRSQSTGNGTGEVEWRYADPVTGSVLEAELSAAFGTENARLLTIRGDLARFSVPFPDMERRGDPSVRIEFRETQTWGFAKFANADRSVRAASRINAENPARRGRATTGEKTFERFAH